MWILIAVLMLNVWAIPADDVLSPNINILEELGKMEARMKSMEKENAAQAKKLEELHVTMNELIKQHEVSKVAFSVSLSSTIGPHDTLQTLIYKHIFLNNGDAYDANTGIFTAPMKGVYVFRVSSKAYGSLKGVSAGLFRNDQHEIYTYAQQISGFISSSNGVSLLLEKGDKICVNLYPGFVINDNEYHHSTFGGHLLFPM
ncbi:complement C1q-like protein 4 [Megalobrama amblycephala]|uniref:complement C1q-like protein 4 n=1 Tax=Megalobrama amblycephala TaxID=75352 RepID=UPI00201407EB|nr:complement C1q-like protein 4 [Megalobrama amblycephala]